MKVNLKTLSISTVLFSIVFNSIAQSPIHKFVFKNNDVVSTSKTNLPQNSVAFLFSNIQPNTTYSNPAIAMLNTNGKVNHKNLIEQNVSVNSLISTEITSLHPEDICIFANTTDDELWVQLKNNLFYKNNFNIEIYNSIGEIEYTSCIDSNLHKINLCNLSAGIYLIKLGDNVQKMIIE